MATLAITSSTLFDWARTVDPDGKPAVVAELLSQSNEILADATFVEGNLPTGHRVSVRTGLPAVYWRSINQGVPASKSTSAQVDEGVGMLEAYCVVDVELARLNGNSDAFRLSEDKAFLEAMNQAQAQTMFYGNPATDPRQYLGLAPRYGVISGAGNAVNIIDAGGTASNNTSIYLVCWSPETVFCTFPKGSVAGLEHEDLGQQIAYDSAGARYQALHTHYVWKNGLVVKDWRYVVRICNINTANLVAGTSAADIVALMSRALDRLPMGGMGKCAFYMNRTVFSQLRLQALNRSSNVLAIEAGLDQFGRSARWTSFSGIPLRRVDQLLNTEARVV